MTVEELKEWYEGRELPTGPIMINSFSTIGDARTFVDREFEILDANPNSKPHDSCRLRLMELKDWLLTRKSLGA
ncbi:DUF6965 family protein [Dyadobacter sp. CY323]|uniref:DUF6965 family protein n=1 Tax=Dyadobacter sp. CY323 TaxID=2907302 RepID=UPI001F414E43|nr:hypothetical protein [Dyadobacter sp. CY323]MCE6989847.1 hypothetical protein [Dyadobacter sp. CY323]